MSGNQFRKRSACTAVLTGMASAALAMAGTAQAEPLWPGGPDVPGVPAIIQPCGPRAGGSALRHRGCAGVYEPVRERGLAHGERQGHLRPHPDLARPPRFRDTPGVFHVASKKEYHWSTMHNAEMKWAVFFNGDIATHIGPIEEQSHGCIRMTPEGAETLYRWVSPGDIIEVVH